MNRIYKTALLVAVLVVLAGAFPQPATARMPAPSPSYAEAELLMSTGEDLLAASQGLSRVPGAGVALISEVFRVEDEVDMAVIEAELNAVKAQRAQVSAACRESKLANAADVCFVRQLDAVCAQQLAELKAQEDALRAIWGDRRKGMAKFFGRVNALRRNIWHGMGTSGRRIFRGIGESVKEMVITGQPVTGSVVRALLRNEVRKEVKAYATRRVVDKISGNVKTKIDCEKEMTESQRRRLPDLLRRDTQPAPSEEPGEEFTNFAGEWYGGGACGEGDDPAYRWNVSLNQDENGLVMGSISFHACPGGGAVYYTVSGQATESKDLTLIGNKTSGRGDLGENAGSRITFTIRYKKAPKPNLSQ